MRGVKLRIKRVRLSDGRRRRRKLREEKNKNKQLNRLSMSPTANKTNLNSLARVKRLEEKLLFQRRLNTVRISKHASRSRSRHRRGVKSRESGVTPILNILRLTRETDMKRLT